jgi:hypothetical protein
MELYSKCPKCGSQIKQIPIRRIDTTVIIELYCENCDESKTFYPKNGEIKFEKASFF